MDIARSVFISYSGEDRAVGEQVCMLLEQQGISCWIAPRNVTPGHDYGEQIIGGIEETRVMVLILSDHANSSIFVKNEVERAISKGKVVIPLRIQNVQPSRALELFVSRSQWVDAWSPPMASRVAVLAAAIRGLLGLPPLEGDAAGQAPGPMAAYQPARAASARGIAQLPRSVRIGGIVALVMLLMAGGLGLALMSGGHSTATTRASSSAVAQGTVRPTATTPTTTLGTLPGQPTSHATGSAIAMPQVAISQANAAQVGQIGMWSKSDTGPSGVWWSSDGTKLAVSMGDVMVFLDAATMSETATISLSNVEFMVATSDLKVIAAVDSTGVQLWSSDGSQLTGKLVDSKNTSSLAFAPNGKYFATQSGGAVKLWDVATGAETQTLISGSGDFGYAVAFSPDGKIVAGSDGTNLKEWDTSTWKPIAVPSCAKDPTSIAFTADGKTIAVATSEGIETAVVSICDVATGKLKRSLDFEASRVAFSPDGSLLLAAGWQTPEMRLWSVASGTQLASLTGPSSQIMGIGFSPDGKLIASAGGDGVRLWGVMSAAPSPTPTAAGPTRSPLPSVAISAKAITPANAAQLKQAAISDLGHVFSITYSPDGKSIAVVTGDGVSILDADTLQVENTVKGGFSGDEVLAVAADLSMMAVMSSPGTQLWDLNGAQLASLSDGEGSTCAAFSPDDRVLATCTGTTVKIWDTSTGANLRTLPGELGEYERVAFTPDGKTLITAGRAVEFWDTSTWKKRKTSDATTFNSIAVSGDGKQVAVSNMGVTICSVATGLRQRTLGNENLIDVMSFSPDGRLIATGSWDHSATVFDIGANRLLKTIAVTTDSVDAVAFSPDGATLAIGSSDGTVRLFRVGS